MLNPTFLAERIPNRAGVFTAVVGPDALKPTTGLPLSKGYIGLETFKGFIFGFQKEYGRKMCIFVDE